MSVTPIEQQEYQTLVIQRKYKDALMFIDKLISNQADPPLILSDIIAKTLQQLQKFDESPEASGYSSLTLLAIARICEDSIKKILPYMKQMPNQKPTIIIGTPLNDYHSLGKSIITAILRSSGWNVIDLGPSLSPQAFVEAALKYNPEFVLISAFLLPSALKCKEIVDALHSANIKAKIIVGGPPFKFHFGLAQKLGCDGMAVDVFDAIRVLEQFISPQNNKSQKKSQEGGWFGKFKKRIFGRKTGGES